VSEVRITQAEMTMRPDPMISIVYSALWASGKSMRDVQHWYDDTSTGDRVLVVR
jgi:hypothetical protein